MLLAELRHIPHWSVVALLDGMFEPSGIADIRFSGCLSLFGMMYTSDVQIPADIKTTVRDSGMFIEWE